MQISLVVLVYDVKINQLGRKNLAVRSKNLASDLIQIKLAAAKITVKTRQEIISSRE
jgi:hypothetical protein